MSRLTAMDGRSWRADLDRTQGRRVGGQIVDHHRVGFREGPDPRAPQGRDMAEAAERPAEIARDGAHIGALAAIGLEHRPVALVMDERDPVDLDRARLQFHHLAVAGEIVGALALDLDGGEARRHLLHLPDEARQQRLDGGRVRGSGRSAHHLALGVVGVGLLAPRDREDVGFAAVHDERDGLGRLAQRDRQDAGGQRIEGARMAGLLGRKRPA